MIKFFCENSFPIIISYSFFRNESFIIWPPSIPLKSMLTKMEKENAWKKQKNKQNERII